MGLRIRKTISLIPGVRLNLSKSGGSVSVGGKGFTVNVGRKGTRETVGLPGSGISYSHNSKRTAGSRQWLWTALLLIGSLVIYSMKK